MQVVLDDNFLLHAVYDKLADGHLNLFEGERDSLCPVFSMFLVS